MAVNTCASPSIIPQLSIKENKVEGRGHCQQLSVSIAWSAGSPCNCIPSLRASFMVGRQLSPFQSHSVQNGRWPPLNAAFAPLAMLLFGEAFFGADSFDTVFSFREVFLATTFFKADLVVLFFADTFFSGFLLVELLGDFFAISCLVDNKIQWKSDTDSNLISFKKSFIRFILITHV